jgi:hypothetical protein
MSRASAEGAYSDLLLEGRWLPVTKSVTFVQADPTTSAGVFEERTRASTEKRFGSRLELRTVRTDGLEPLLEELLPLRIEDDRSLFVPTANPEWTAVFTNARRGTDPNRHAVLGDWGLRAVTVTDVPNTMDERTNQGFWGERTFRLVEPWAPRHRGAYVVESMVHSVTARITDDGWLFGAHSGYFDENLDIPFPVGKVWDETARRVQDRFTHEHLVEACRRLGLRPFDADFYAPRGAGLILERTDPQAALERAFTLAQARGDEPVD